MSEFLMSAASGIAFAMGITFFFFVRDMATEKGRGELKKEMMAYHALVEKRLAVQIDVMAACLEEIKQHQKTKGGAA